MSPAPHPYLRRHLLTHAYLGGCLDDETIPASFLPWDTSGVARVGIGLPAQDESRPRLATLAALEPSAEELNAADRAASLALLLLPPPATGTATAGWADWAIERNLLTRSRGYVTRLAAARNRAGAIVAAVQNADRIDVWDVIGAQQLTEVPAESNPTGLFAVGTDDADKIWLAVKHRIGPGSRSTIVLWDVALGEPVAGCALADVQAMMFCPRPSGNVLALGTKSGSVLLAPLPGLEADRTSVLRLPWPVTALAAGAGESLDGLLAVGGPEPEIMVVDSATGRLVWTVSSPTEPRRRRLLRRASPPQPATQLALAMAGGEPRLAELRFGVVRLWNPATGALLAQDGESGNDVMGGYVSDMALLDDGGATQLASNSPRNGQIRLVDAADGATTYPPIAAHDHWVGGLIGVAGIRSERWPPVLLSAGAVADVRMWPAGCTDLAARVEPDSDPTTALAFGLDRDGWPVLLAGARNSTRVFTADSGELRRAVDIPVFAAGTGVQDHMLVVQVTPDGAWVHDLSVGVTIGPRLHGWEIFLFAGAVGTHAAGRPLLVLADAVGAHLWDPCTGKRDATLTLPAWGNVEAVAMGAGGLVGIECGDSTVRVVDAATRRVLLEQPTPGARCVLALGSVQGGPRFLALAPRGGTRLTVWDVDDHRRLATIETLGDITALAFGADRFGDALAVAGSRGQLVVPWTRLIRG